jgi:hypothetical protein
MAFAIVLAPEAVEDLATLKATVRSAVKGALETHLRHEPQKTSRSRIKRVRGLSLQIPRHAGLGFHVMPGRYSTVSRATVPR